jgi:hypothetical protein
MSEENLTLLGGAITLMTIFMSRIFQEQNLKLWTDREKLEWVELFAGFRIAGICIPITIFVLSAAAGYLLPDSRGWSIVITAIALLLFSLLWQYFQLRRFAHYRFGQDFIRRSSWIAAATQAGLIVGLSLVAFGLAGSLL